MSSTEQADPIAFAPVAPDVRLDIYRGEEWITAFANDVRSGLTATEPELPPKYFYDAAGSELFDRICQLPEYYPTRTEAALLSAHGDEIVDQVRARSLVELGSGSSTKTEHLLRTMLSGEAEVLYVPIDFSESAVRESAVRLVGEYRGLRVHGVIGDFERHLGGLPEGEGRLIAFLGGTIGNFTPPRMHSFLRRLATLVGSSDSLLVGIDLVKDRAELEAAYNDSAGVTAAFNRNVLASINRNLGGDFDLASWRHRAFFDPEMSWIEMRLVAERDQTVQIAAIDTTLEFVAGDEIRTEISRKFTQEGFTADLVRSGFTVKEWFTDERQRFALVLASRAAQLASS